jgi:hypothetical protein
MAGLRRHGRLGKMFREGPNPPEQRAMDFLLLVRKTETQALEDDRLGNIGESGLFFIIRHDIAT